MFTRPQTSQPTASDAKPVAEVAVWPAVLALHPLPDQFPVERTVGPYYQHGQCHQRVNASIQGNVTRSPSFTYATNTPNTKTSIMDQGRSRSVNRKYASKV